MQKIIFISEKIQKYRKCPALENPNKASHSHQPLVYHHNIPAMPIIPANIQIIPAWSNVS